MFCILSKLQMGEIPKAFDSVLIKNLKKIKPEFTTVYIIIQQFNHRNIISLLCIRFHIGTGRFFNEKTIIRYLVIYK
jgi:hypothetical protein